MNRFAIKYEFHFLDRRVREYLVQLDSDTMEQISSQSATLPLWTALDFHQCSNCALDPASHSHCPLAVNLVELVAVCNDLNSYDEIDVRITTPEREITASTTAQRGISSLLGLTIATSPCPHTKYFRPMARFHLPLASEEETFYRATSMYLLAQYYLTRNGKVADMELHGLADIYQNIQIINQAMANRLREASEDDGTVNAIILLDVLAKALPYVIEDELEEMRYLFAAYFSSSDRCPSDSGPDKQKN